MPAATIRIRRSQRRNFWGRLEALNYVVLVAEALSRVFEVAKSRSVST